MTIEGYESLFNKAHELKNMDVIPDYLRGKIMAALFYEPSTRTRVSFTAAMMRLGGQVITTENAGEFSSEVKGESLEDTIRVTAGNVDVIVLRHHTEGSFEIAQSVSPVPVLNAGDGAGSHPTQSMLDLFTIQEEIGRLDNFNISFVGDVKYGRTVKSLAKNLSTFQNVNMKFIAPESVGMTNETRKMLDDSGVQYEEISDLNRGLAESDIIYMTRLQKERMEKDEYDAAKGMYRIDDTNIHLVPDSSRIMHPLPKIAKGQTDKDGEPMPREIALSKDIEDNDPRIAYFRQADNGLYTRMALLLHTLGKLPEKKIVMNPSPEAAAV